MENIQINFNEKGKFYLKLLSAISSIFLMIIMIIISTLPPANSYELSIYNAYPWYFWIFLITVVILSISTLILYSITGMNGNIWIVGLFLLMFVYFIFLLLPIFRGYHLFGRGGADVLTHLGHMKTILNTGNLYEENFYPITHILHVIISYFGLPLEKIATFIPAFFSSIYLIFILLLAKIIGRTVHHAVFILAFSSPLLFSFFHTCIHPFMIGLYMFPLIIYSVNKRRVMGKKFNFSVIVIIFSFMIVFTHPLMTLIIIMVFSLFIGFRYLYTRFGKNNSVFKIRENFNVIIIIISSFLTWYISFRLIQNLFYKIFVQLGEPISSSYANTVSSSPLSIFHIIKLLIFKYAPIGTYLSIAALFAVLIFIKFLSKKGKVNSTEFSYTGQVLLGVALGSIFLLNYLIVADPIRAFIYGIFISSVFLGLIFFNQFKILLNKNINKYLKISSLCFILSIVLFSSIICIANVYPSPITSSPNQQMTDKELTGLNFFLNKKLDYLPTASKGFSFKIQNYFFGIDKASSNEIVRTFYLELPSHFGYNQNDSVLKSLNTTKSYIVLSQYNLVAYRALPKVTWSVAHRYSEEDFLRINSDSSVINFFDNDNFELRLASN